MHRRGIDTIFASLKTAIPLFRAVPLALWGNCVFALIFSLSEFGFLIKLRTKGEAEAVVVVAVCSGSSRSDKTLGSSEHCSPNYPHEARGQSLKLVR